jgi:methylthioribulose-1-phosphate dehydratase
MNEKAIELVDTVRYIADRGWSPATGGNYSVRIDEQHCLITQSGIDKASLTEDDLMVCNLDGQSEQPGLIPSAEAALHTALYRADHGIGAVLHTHSVNATVLSRASGKRIVITGYEMQKALSGNKTHAESIEFYIFDNNQDIPALANRVIEEFPQQPGFLVRGHGLYAWGSSVAEARRHVEGFEFLFACLWQERLLGR